MSGNDSAYPRSYAAGNSGISKRELFAAMAMQGISSNTELCDQTRGTVQQVAEWAVGQADALLAQLEKSP